MARLIDAKELERQIKVTFKDSNPVLMGQMLRWVRCQTTVDAVPVVRCKDCKHQDEYGDCDIHDTWFTRKPDSFCCYGEMKDND